MERKRLVYSSLDNNRHQNHQQQKPKTRKKKKIRNQNEHLINAARIYLQEAHLSFKNETKLLQKSNNCGQKVDPPHRYGTLQSQPQETQAEGKNQQIYRHVNRSRNSKVNQKYLLDSYKTRYNIHQFSGAYTERSRKICSSSGTRIKSAKKQKLALDEYFKKLKQQNRERGLQQISQAPRKQNDESIQNLAKIYLHHKIDAKQLITPRNTKPNALAELYSSAKQQKVNNYINANKNSVKSFKTIENKQRLHPRNIKGFVINQKDQIVSKLLLAQGWKQFGQHSQRYTLKWTYNDSFKDYQLLRNSYRDERLMYFNHVCNNKLVSKDGFAQIANSLKQKGVQIANWIPETYIIGTQKSAFLDSYNMRSIFTGLNKHYEYFRIKRGNPDKIQKINQKILKVISWLTKIDQKSAEKSILSKNQRQDLVVNIPLLYNLIILSCNYWLYYENIEDESFLTKFSCLCQDIGILSTIIAFNKADLLFQEYHRFRSTSRKRNQKLQNKNISIINGYLKAVKTFMTPSEEIIEASFLFHQYFTVKLGHQLKGGLKNIWILKPCAGSRGCGIEIIDRIDKPNHIFDTSANRIAQKYLQNIWIFPQSQRVDEYQRIANKKFDIRQWVLISPPSSYIFSSFYIRICSKQYDFETLNDPCCHLSNFSVNRDNYRTGEESVMSEKEFQALLSQVKQGKKYLEIKKNIKQRLKLLVDEAILQSEAIQGSFQVLGFDILLDQHLNPWVIECNMSPACSPRTEWLKEMKAAMVVGALDLVVDPTLFNATQFGQSQEYRWEKLSKVGPFSNNN